MSSVFVFYYYLIVSCQHLKQKQNWLTSALWNYAKTCIKQNQQTGVISLSDSRWRLWKSSDKRGKMQSKLLSSQFPSEIDSYKPPPQYLYFSSYNQWACSACTIFSLFASVHFSPCLQEINLWTFILAETAVELLFWRKTPASVKRGLQTRLISNLAKYCQHLPINMLKMMLMWKSVTGGRCGLRCALNSQHIQKQTSLWTEPLWDAENTGSRAASARLDLKHATQTGLMKR